MLVCGPAAPVAGSREIGTRIAGSKLSLSRLPEVETGFAFGTVARRLTVGSRLGAAC